MEVVCPEVPASEWLVSPVNRALGPDSQRDPVAPTVPAAAGYLGLVQRFPAQDSRAPAPSGTPGKVRAVAWGTEPGDSPERVLRAVISRVTGACPALAECKGLAAQAASRDSVAEAWPVPMVRASVPAVVAVEVARPVSLARELECRARTDMARLAPMDMAVLAPEARDQAALRVRRPAVSEVVLGVAPEVTEALPAAPRLAETLPVANPVPTSMLRNRWVAAG
jgi:hypothetical protein